ncbi:hypothetical protein [Streptomyces sp. x-80]|uniref:hypothetical protein n=1 Tax=Streptomyces sp. x-80 TaxID=2789282 RepID=UPI00398140A2
MRLHTITALGLSALAVLALAGCSNGGAPTDAPASSASTSASQEGKNPPVPASLSSVALSKRLLNVSDLGEGYTLKAQRTAQHDDVTVIGCPALEKLGGDAATGSSLDFPRKAKASFTYAGGSDSEVSEELYSDSATKLSKGTSEIFDAMASCPTYQVTSGSTAIDVGTQKTAAPDLADQQWSQVLTYTASGQRSVVKQTAIRTGNVLVVLSGSPGLVDTHVDKALAKAQAAR